MKRRVFQCDHCMGIVDAKPAYTGPEERGIEMIATEPWLTVITLERNASPMHFCSKQCLVLHFSEGPDHGRHA